MNTFYNKNILVTGARGLSWHASMAFARERANIGILHGNRDELMELERALGGLKVRNYGFRTDLSSRHSLVQATHLFRNQFLMADIMLLAPELHSGSDIIDLPENDIEKEVITSVAGSIFLVKHFLPDIVKKQEGTIVFLIDRSAALSPLGAASLGALEAFSASLNAYFRSLGLVNVFSSVVHYTDAGKPGVTDHLLKGLGRKKKQFSL